MILQALQDSTLHGVLLVMIGDNKHLLNRIGNMELKDRVHYLGRLDDSQVGYVISKAIALVFPSYYEGFGLPPMEAALLGIPSICSSRPAMTELLKGVALFADPESPKEWSDAIRRICDLKLRNELSRNAKSRANEFTWEKSALRHIEILRKMALQNK